MIEVYSISILIDYNGLNIARSLAILVLFMNAQMRIKLPKLSPEPIRLMERKRNPSVYVCLLLGEYCIKTIK